MNQPKYRHRWWDALDIAICMLILFGLILPTIREDRDRGPRRAQCHYNLKQLSLATINFETSKKQLPGYQSQFGNNGAPGKIGSWVVSLLPFVEEMALRDVWDDASLQRQWEAEYTGAVKTETFYPAIPVLICPHDISKDYIRAPLSYLANTGFYLRPQDPALQLQAYANITDPSEQSSIAQRSANGVFANGLPATVVDPRTGNLCTVFGTAKSPIRSRDLKDGLSSTIVFSEGLGKRSWSDIS